MSAKILPFQAPSRVELRTKQQLLDWGDGWMRAYYDLERLREHELLMARTDFNIESAQNLLQRMALEDEIKRLKKLLAAATSDCPF